MLRWCLSCVGGMAIVFQLILYNQTVVLSSWRRSGENRARSRKRKQRCDSSAVETLSQSRFTEENQVPRLQTSLRVLLRCCSTSSSLSTWSWTWWPAVRGLRSCSAWRATAPLPPPGPTRPTSWSRARCRASCGWRRAPSSRPSQARPSGSTQWAAPRPRPTSSASSKSTRARNDSFSRGEEDFFHTDARDISLTSSHRCSFERQASQLWKFFSFFSPLDKRAGSECETQTFGLKGGWNSWMNVCRDNRCDGSHSVDEGLHIKDRKYLDSPLSLCILS